MKLRVILLALSIMAVLSASTGGYLYYSAVKDAALNEAERQAVTRLELITKNLSSFLSENIKAVKALAGMDELLEMLIRPDAVAQNNANAILDLYKSALEVDVCYLMNYKGDTVASSNRNAPDSFVGKNFAFRPYFQEAFHKAPATYLALGTTSGKRGVYHSYPVFEKGEDIPIGLVVIKGSIELIEKELSLLNEEIVLVADPMGVVFISNVKEWLYQVLWEISEADREKISASRQFGKGPWNWIGMRRIDDKYATGGSGITYQIHTADVDPDHYPGWKVYHLRSLKTISKSIADPLLKLAGPVILTFCTLLGISVFFLYRKASQEITQRKEAEKALRESEERYRSLYHNTPAMLHSIDTSGRLVSVSDYWAEAMGYTRSEVIGRNLTDFFTDESSRYAEEKVYPEFFKTGFCKDIAYQFVKKNGRIIDVLLSAIADRDSKGSITRTLAVSIDVTERKRAEEALRLAKEELSRYSKDLERQVEIRTREISSILKYTPAVVYIKDVAGRYLHVNSRYEELFQVRNEDIRGKTDYDILPKQVADQFRSHDTAVLTDNHSRQVEERIPQEDGMHTYLSVKFPVYDATGSIRGVCGIAADITAEKKAQEQLRRLSASIMDNQEQERSAIARELHDELGQVLTALRMDAIWIRERLREIDAKSADRALTMCELIDKTIEDVRGLAFRLRPGILDDLGLVDALELYTTDFEKRTGITCVFDHADIPITNNTVATAAYRITQEALTNVVRHAGASHVNVTIGAANGMLTLAVTDDGQGFDMADLGEFEGLGLAGMRERASLAGGLLDVIAQPDRGTHVYFRVPVDGAGTNRKLKAV